MHVVILPKQAGRLRAHWLRPLSGDRLCYVLLLQLKRVMGYYTNFGTQRNTPKLCCLNQTSTSLADSSQAIAAAAACALCQEPDQRLRSRCSDISLCRIDQLSSHISHLKRRLQRSHCQLFDPCRHGVDHCKHPDRIAARITYQPFMRLSPPNYYRPVCRHGLHHCEHPDWPDGAVHAWLHIRGAHRHHLGLAHQRALHMHSGSQVRPTTPP
jgi:hypothetical protein